MSCRSAISIKLKSNFIEIATLLKSYFGTPFPKNTSGWLLPLFVISQVYDGLIYDQMYKFFDQIFFKFQYGFFNEFNTQNYFIYDRKLEEKTALLSDLSKDT